MICETPCKNCNRKGLPILFTRYGVAYAAQPSRATTLKTLTPSGNLEATPGNVKLGQAFYNLRLLRAGFLYIRIQRPKQPVEWLGYAVHPQGYLTAFDAGFPSSARAHMACKRDQRQANASLVWIADALKVEKLHYLFSPDPLNPEHLNKEINVKPDAHMQSFDVAGWAGGSRNAKHSSQPGQLNSQVVEFSALSSEAAQQAFESQLYGLMGSNAQERGWGDWEEDVMDISPEVFGAEYQAASSSTRTVKHRGPSYAAAHGERLKQMAAFLQTHQGAVVACHDAFGITQELGHAFPEAQVAYTHWQLQQAQGQATGVTNEWVYQTAVGARSLQDLLKKNAIQTTEQHIKEWNERITNNPVPVYYPDLETKTREEARRKATIARNQQLARQQAAKKTEEVFTKLFDETAAGTIIQAQGSAYKSQQDKLAELGKDHNAWIASSMFEHTIAHYSAKDAHIALAGGGAALSLQLAQCLSGLETNREGLQVLRGMDLYGSNALARLISFNSAALLAVLKQMDVTAQKATTLPGAEPTTEWADFMADILVKPVAANFGLGDKALGFIEAIPAAGVSGQLRKKAWPLFVSTAIHVKLMEGINKLPVSTAEAWVARKVGALALITQGTKAHEQVRSLAKLNQDRLRNAARSLNNKGLAATQNMAKVAAGNARAAALGSLFDVGNAIIKGYQLGVKKDARTAVEMVGSLLQGTGSVLDWRAKIYEETVFKGVTGADLFTAPAMREAFDQVQATTLKRLRYTAFKFLLPAAMISIYWDATDGLMSIDRKQYLLGGAQLAGAIGTVFTITGAGAGVAAMSVGGGSALWGGIAATLGLIGAVLAIASVVVVLLLKEEDWIIWLRDMPLNRERNGLAPLHKNLAETQQKLVGAIPTAAI